MIKDNTLSYRKIQAELIFLLNENSENDFYHRLKSVLEKFSAMIKQHQFISAGANENIQLNSHNIIESIESEKQNLLKFLDYYLKGQISSCYNAFHRWWRQVHMMYYEEEYDTNIFYRMRQRKDKDKDFTYKDLLHIPFDLRGKVENQRYSISGLPCLYISTSLYQSWEELRRPYLQHLYAVAMRFTEKLNLLDMRLIREISSEKQLKSYLKRLPLIIACSMKVKNDDDSFKPEYILSQTLLHTVIRNGIDGILYSSVRKDFSFYNENVWDFSNNENLVIPVKTSASEGFCKQLLRIMEISNSLNIEQEMIKGSLKLEKNDNYKNTLLGQMECVLKSVVSNYPINPHGLKSGMLSFGLNHNISRNRVVKHVLK